MRPTLLPHLRRLWRDRDHLQLGSDPTEAPVLHLARPEVVRALDLLDGSTTALGLLDDVTRLGLDEADVREFVATLQRLGLVYGSHELLPAGITEPVRRRLAGEAAAIALRLRSANGPVIKATSVSTPADVLRRRAAARILVAGDGPLVTVVAAALAASGVGLVDPALSGSGQPADLAVGGLTGDDIGQPRAISAAAAITRAAPGTDVTPIRTGSATFLVLFGARQSTALAVRGLRLRNMPRLEVGIRLGTVTVGPLVRPYRSPCRECLELHRRDRDPVWPALRAQLATAPDGADEPCTQATVLAGAAYVTEEVLAFIDGAELRTEAAMVEIARPGELKRREWAAHPRCDCRRRRRYANGG